MNKKIAKLGEKTNLAQEEVNKFTKIGLSGLLALTLSIFAFGWGNSNAAGVDPQPKKDKVNPLPERCRLYPESGPCKAIFKKYYFDAATKRCREFIYGGCEGVVPFDTKEECDKACAGPIINIPPNTDNPYPVSKYGAIGIRDFKDAK